MVAPIDRSKGVRLVVPTPDLGMWTIRTGWGLIGLYGFQVGMAPSRPPPMSSIRSR